MSYFVSCKVAIAGITAVVPQKKIYTDNFIERFGEKAVEKFKQNSKITEVHQADTEQTAGDLAFAAAEYLLDKLCIPKDEIGVLTFITQAGDYIKPATACVLQHRLGLSNDCACFDVNLGCSAFVYGDQLVRSFLSGSVEKYGLLLIADTASKAADNEDNVVSMLIGDAGSAILYKKEDNAGENVTLLRTDGAGFNYLIVPAGGYRDANPDVTTFVDNDGKEHSKYSTYMNGMEVFKFSISEVPKAINEYMAFTGKTVNDFDSLLLHQANYMIIKHIAKKLNVPMEKVPISIDRFGNTGGVTIPLTLCDAFGDCNKKEVNILAAGFGIGLSWGVTSFRIGTDVIFPIIETNEAFTAGKFLP